MIILTILFSIILISIPIIIYKIKRFNKNSELSPDIDDNINGMLIDLIDDGLKVRLYNKSYEGKYTIDISSNVDFEYNKISEYVLQVIDYIRATSKYKNVDIYRHNWAHDMSYFTIIHQKQPSNSYISLIVINFEIDKDFIDRILFRYTDNTGPR